jgi:hypothetical protein
MAGWGTTTVVLSGRDVYTHYAAPEFAFALRRSNKPTSSRFPLLDFVADGGLGRIQLPCCST